MVRGFEFNCCQIIYLGKSLYLLGVAGRMASITIISIIMTFIAKTRAQFSSRAPRFAEGQNFPATGLKLR